MSFRFFLLWFMEIHISLFINKEAESRYILFFFINKKVFVLPVEKRRNQQKPFI